MSCVSNIRAPRFNSQSIWLIFSISMKRQRKKLEYSPSNWTTDQDCFLIENSELPIEELMNHLSFDEEEIQSRKEILGLGRRQRQMRKFLNS